MFKRDNKERKHPNKKRSLSAPVSIYFSCSTFYRTFYIFQKHRVDLGVDGINGIDMAAKNLCTQREEEEGGK